AAPLRLAAAQILARAELSDAQFLKLLGVIGKDALMTPETILPLLMRGAKPATAAALLDYLRLAGEKGWTPSEEKLLQIVKPFEREQEAAVEGLFAVIREKSADKRQRLAALEPLLVGGDAQTGRAIFFGDKVSCFTCHRVGTNGGQVGPDLTKVG